MRNTTVFSRKYNDLKVLEAALKDELELRPHIEPYFNELQGILGEAESLQLRQEAARAEFRELIRLRQEIEVRGDAIRSRIAAFLRGELGYRSEKLFRFGILPLPRVRSRKPDFSPPPPEAPAPQADEKPTE